MEARGVKMLSVLFPKLDLRRRRAERHKTRSRRAQLFPRLRSRIFRWTFSLNIGPAYTKEWNSPFSPHGSALAGRSRSRVSSKSRPTKSEDNCLGSTQTSFARSPALIISCASCSRRKAPDGKQRFQSGVFQLAFTVSPNVGEKKIAKSNGGYAIRQCLVADALHRRFILGVGARPRYGRDNQRQSRSFSLHFHQRPPRAVHGNTIKRGVERRHEAGDFILVLLTQNVQGPRAVFAAAPRQKDLLFHAE